MATSTGRPTSPPTANASVGATLELGEATRTISDLVQQVGHLRNRASLLVADSQEVHDSTSELHLNTLDKLLRSKAAQRAKEDITTSLSYLSSLGLAWSDVARVIGVSVPALRKWRQGESATGENRLKVGNFAAFCSILEEAYLFGDLGSWLETPLDLRAPITPLDLLADGRYDLGFVLAGDGNIDPESVLDQYESDWRTRYDSAVEVFEASDGTPGLRLRS